MKASAYQKVNYNVYYTQLNTTHVTVEVCMWLKCELYLYQEHLKVMVNQFHVWYAELHLHFNLFLLMI